MWSEKGGEGGEYGDYLIYNDINQTAKLKLSQLLTRTAKFRIFKTNLVHGKHVKIKLNNRFSRDNWCIILGNT